MVEVSFKTMSSLLHLNDDCLCAVLEYFSFEDLTIISEVSDRFDVAIKHTLKLGRQFMAKSFSSQYSATNFLTKFESEIINFHIGREEHYVLDYVHNNVVTLSIEYPDERAVTILSDKIQNVESLKISCGSGSHIPNLLSQTLKIKSIEFSSCEISFEDIDFNRLVDLNSLLFEHCGRKEYSFVLARGRFGSRILELTLIKSEGLFVDRDNRHKDGNFNDTQYAISMIPALFPNLISLTFHGLNYCMEYLDPLLRPNIFESFRDLRNLKKFNLRTGFYMGFRDFSEILPNIEELALKRRFYYIDENYDDENNYNEMLKDIVSLPEIQNLRVLHIDNPLKFGCGIDEFIFREMPNLEILGLTKFFYFSSDASVLQYLQKADRLKILNLRKSLYCHDHKDFYDIATEMVKSRCNPLPLEIYCNFSLRENNWVKIYDEDYVGMEPCEDVEYYESDSEDSDTE